MRQRRLITVTKTIKWPSFAPVVAPLHPEERELLGVIQGISVVHLQCNSGQDTLSLASLGTRVTGVDISESPIAFARSLSHDTGIPVTFHRMDIYDWFEEAALGLQRFDLAFCSHGVICWLSDLLAWAKGIARILASEGRFVLIDYLPTARMFTWYLRRQYSYFTDGEPSPLSRESGTMMLFLVRACLVWNMPRE